MNKKQWISLVGFLLCAVLLLGGLGALLRDKGSSFDSYYEQPENTIDALFVGSSHVYCGYCPAILWQEYGVSAYNVYAWSQPIWTAYYYTKEALKTQEPQVVFLDVSSVCYGAGGADTSDIDRTNLETNLNFRGGVHRLALLWESRYVGGQALDMGEWCDLALYHNKWKYPEQIELIHQNDDSLAFLRNFGGLFSELEYEIFNYSFYTDVTPPNARVAEYLDKFVALAEKEEFRLVFVLTPYTSNEQQNAVLNWLHAYADEKGVDFLDFLREAGTECGFDYQADMADGDHVNVRGAFKLTRRCGDYLKSIGLAGQEDNPAAEELDRAAAATLRMIEYTDLLDGGCTPERIAAWLRSHNDYTAALIWPQTPSDAQRVMAACGASVTVLDAPANGDSVRIRFPDAERSVKTDGEEWVLLDATGELWRADADDAVLILHDGPMNRLVYAIAIHPDGTVAATGFSSTLQGAGQNAP